MNHRQTSSSDSYFGWQAFPEYIEANARRAKGEAPIKESHKAAINLMNQNVDDWSTIIDVGCSAGHFLTALRSLCSKTGFTYNGVDMDGPAISRAENIFASLPPGEANFAKHNIENLPFMDRAFDIAVSMNVLEHLATPLDAISEMWRVARKLVLIRTYVATQTYLIREVRNQNNWSGPREVYDEVPAARDELDHSGEPKSYVFQNIWGCDYLKENIAKLAPEASVHVIEDLDFSAEAINYDAATTALPLGTKVINNMQVVGPLITPNHWIILRRPE